jgi:hypothetical protein
MDDQPTPVVPPLVRTWLYIVGTIVLGVATAVIGEVDDLWVRLGTGFGTAVLAVAFGYRPTR